MTIKPAEAALFSAPSGTKTVSKPLIEQPKRYDNLKSIDVKKEEVIPKTTLKPQISEKWAAGLKSAPKIEDLYDKSLYEPELSDLGKIKIQARLVGGSEQLSKEVDIWADAYSNS